MINYLKSETYRVLHRKSTYIFIGICSLLLMSSNIVLAAVKQSDGTFPYATTKFAFSLAYTGISMVYILCIVVSNMIYSNEYRNNTMKNCVAYGIPRETIYFGKFIMQLIYSVIALFVIIGIYITSAYLLLENSGAAELGILIRTCFAAMPLLIVGLATMNCAVFMIEGSGAAVTAALGLMVGLPTVCNLLAMRFQTFKHLSDVLPWNILNYNGYDPASQETILYWSTQEGLRNCWIIGILETILLIAVGYAVFRKKEIK